MQFRHPEQLDRQRYHHELSDRGRLGRLHPSANPATLLVILALLALLAVASLSTQGASLTPLLDILAGFAALLLLACCPSD